jgi:hypothetical protein
MSDIRPIIATWLVADTVAERTEYPQVPGDSATFAFQAVYWRCVVCFFATASKMQVPARRILFTNVSVIPYIDGYDLAAVLQRFGVEVIRLPITHRLHNASVQRWGNQFYILDIIRGAERNLQFDSLVVLDSDCVWVRDAGGLLDDLARFGILTLELAHREDELINGISRQNMKLVAQSLAGRSFKHVPHYVGGEIFACTRSKISEVRDHAERLWEMIENDPSPLLREEAHFLSVIYDVMNIPPGTADAHLKRMWTAFHLNNVTSEDLIAGRCLWHLPYEKRDGFADLFTEVLKPGSAFWQLPNEQIPAYMARTMGVPRRNAVKWLRNFAARLYDKASGATRVPTGRSIKL